MAYESGTLMLLMAIYDFERMVTNAHTIKNNQSQSLPQDIVRKEGYLNMDYGSQNWS